MSFIEQFYYIINQPNVKSRMDELLREGEKHKQFINYFGVNFNKETIVSVKLYFSFFETPSATVLDKLNLSENQSSKIDQYWNPPNKYEYFHQGLTIALKCYLSNDNVIINDYIHFRSDKLPFIPPKYVELSEEDKKHYVGVCFEKHDNLDENKNYYYITSNHSKQLLLNDFGLNKKLSNKISFIEYTESNIERKLNLIFTSTEDVKKYFQELNNANINEMNTYFYNKYKLYFFAPGLRYNSSTKAIYYVPKETFYTQHELRTIQELLKNNDGIS